MLATATATGVLEISQWLNARIRNLSFSGEVAFVYNPLEYAHEAWHAYVTRFLTGPVNALIAGMNPGPWGMAQTGVPFGEVNAVTTWMGIGRDSATIGRPPREHPKRPVLGFDCQRSEVSGRRLWGLMAARFGAPERFFENHAVINYCPLLFLAASGRNITPDRLPYAERNPLLAYCDGALQRTVATLQPRHLIGVGNFAAKRLEKVRPPGATVIRILHPSPASPAANRDWAATATRQLRNAGVWP